MHIKPLKSLSVFQKLMLIVLTTMILLISVMIYLALWSYRQGFLDYANTLEHRRLERVSPALIDIYIQSGRDLDAMPKEQVSILINSFPKPLERDSGLGLRAGPPPEVIAKLGSGLYDLDNRFITGSKNLINYIDSELVIVPLMYRGEKIAILKAIPNRQVREPIETELSKTHWARTVSLSILVLLGITIIPISLSLLVYKPVRRVLKAIAKVSRGEYAIKFSDKPRDELGKLMRDVEHLAYTLQQTQASRKKWLANISHDMRTPLTVMMGEIQSIKDGIRTFDLDRLRSLEQEVALLKKYTDDIYELSLSEIGGLRYEFKPIDILGVVGSAVDSMQWDADQKQIALKLVGTSATVFGDRSRLQQLFKNILRNSVDYTESPGQINVLVENMVDKALITIEDSYPGVPDKSHSNLFEALYREDYSRNSAKKGGGLGLAICKNIVEAHNGSIVAESSELGGLKVAVELRIKTTGGRKR